MLMRGMQSRLVNSTRACVPAGDTGLSLFFSGYFFVCVSSHLSPGFFLMFVCFLLLFRLVVEATETVYGYILCIASGGV